MRFLRVLTNLGWKHGKSFLPFDEHLIIVSYGNPFYNSFGLACAIPGESEIQPEFDQDCSMLSV